MKTIHTISYYDLIKHNFNTLEVKYKNDNVLTP